MAGWWREQAKRVSRSKGWNKIRDERIHIDGGKCRACGRKNNLQGHHIKPFHIDPALELDISNTITLCGRCHILIGHLDNWKSYNQQVIFDSVTTRMRIEGRP
jgi:5-methylcytosine-specific restriction endonuclease McrA